MGAIIKLDAYKLIMRFFFFSDVPTWVHKNGHNSTYDQYFFMKFAPHTQSYQKLDVIIYELWNIPSGPFWIITNELHVYWQKAHSELMFPLLVPLT